MFALRFNYEASPLMLALTHLSASCNKQKKRFAIRNRSQHKEKKII